MLFRGRERQHRNIAMETFNEITVRFAEIAKIERPAKFENKKMTMVLAATKRPTPQKPPKPAKAKPPREKADAGDAPEGGAQAGEPVATRDFPAPHERAEPAERPAMMVSPESQAQSAEQAQ
jgi:hypothetical protein